MKKLAVIWDLDGTLLDTLADLTDSTNRTLAHFGFPTRTAREVRSFVGNGAGQLLAKAVPPGTEEAVTRQALRWFQLDYARHCQDQTGPYPGIPEALAALKALGYPMAVVSNKPDGAVKELARQWFPDLYARGEGPDCPRKPAPDMVFRAMEALGVSRCIYVGDSEVDIRTARRAGVPCLSVLWGFRSHEALLEAGGKHFCPTPQALVSRVEEMEREYGK